MDIFHALGEDHDDQRTLPDLLTRTEGDSTGRDELFARTKAALQNHAAAEERYVYVPLMEKTSLKKKPDTASRSITTSMSSSRSSRARTTARPRG